MIGRPILPLGPFARKEKAKTSTGGAYNKAPDEAKNARASQEIEYSRVRNLRACNLFELEFLRPGDHRPPDELIHGHDYADHHQQAPDNGPRIRDVCRRLQVGSQSGNAKILISQNKHFAGHQVKPSGGYGYHRVPDESDGGKRKLHFGELLPTAPAINFRDFMHLTRDGFQRRIKAERHIPCLTRENQQNGTKLDPKLAPRKKSNHSQHDAGQKAQDRNRLKRIEQRNHDAFSFGVVGRDVSVGDAENQGNEVGNRDSSDRKQGVSWQRSRPEVNFGMRADWGEPIMRHRQKGVEDGESGQENRQVLEEGWRTWGNEPPDECLTERLTEVGSRESPHSRAGTSRT